MVLTTCDKQLKAVPREWLTHKHYLVRFCRQDRTVHAYPRFAVRGWDWPQPRHSEIDSYPDRHCREELETAIFWPGGYPVGGVRICQAGCFNPGYGSRTARLFEAVACAD
ncbi:hypothetical protein SAMN05421854_11032 [Amycolatopsis rubida]|uniref:Uncharacterized protein n=1 Tax=Amycolatopsis rubida TaxID=112413 RepID=A0A1I5X4V7_9PSEU|nr:hypothetical protein SAMN05421854_11032 [Amycolatopsis rubida]